MIHHEEWGFNWDVAVNNNLEPLSYLLCSIGGIVLKDIKGRHICRLDYKLHINTDYHMVRFSQRRMRSNSARVRIRTKQYIKNIWLIIITVRNGSREIYNLGEVLGHSKLMTKHTCNISGLGMMKPLGVSGIKSPHIP